MANGNKFLSQFKVIIDFAVEDYREAAILTRHRLRAATDVNNRKPAVAEADLKSLVRRLVKPIARAVRPAVGHQVSKADESLAILTLRSPEDPPKYPAHGCCLVWTAIR